MILDRQPTDDVKRANVVTLIVARNAASAPHLHGSLSLLLLL